jgi:hypothetical protein
MEQKQSRKTIIDHRIAYAIFDMYEMVYKQGFEDAYRVGDSAYCEDFINHVRVPNVYGFITDDHTIGWSEWALRLMVLGRSYHFNGALRDYFNMIYSYNSFAACAYIVAQEMYIKGMKDFMEQPCGMETISQLKEKRSSKYVKGKVSHRTRAELLEEVQLAIFERIHTDEGYLEQGNRYAHLSTHYRTFSRALWAGVAERKWETLEEARQRRRGRPRK